MAWIIKTQIFFLVFLFFPSIRTPSFQENTTIASYVAILCGNLIHLRIKHKTWKSGCYVPTQKKKGSRILKVIILCCLKAKINMLFPYLRYGRVMTFNNDGFLETKFCHSILSIFPSWFTSASMKVCPQILRSSRKIPWDKKVMATRHETGIEF